jgi:hypothetical protein
MTAHCSHGRAVARLSLILVCACSAQTGPDNPTALSVQALSGDDTALSDLDFAALHVSGRDAGYSAHFANVSAWVFGDTFTSKPPADGSTLSSTWSWTGDTQAADGIGPFQQPPDPNDPSDPGGAPAQLIPYDAAGYENAFNVYHACSDTASPCACPAADDQCGDRFALWPGPVVPYKDTAGAERAVLAYMELIVHRGELQYTPRGSSFARWDDPTKPSVRTEPPVFDASDVKPTAAALKYTAWDGTKWREFLYAYACTTATFPASCSLARAPFEKTGDALASIVNRSAWRFYQGGNPNAASSWTASASSAASVLSASTTFSVQWNAYLQKYTAIYSLYGANDVYIQTATRPEGPWSGHSGQPLFSSGEPPSEARFADYYALAHPEFDAVGAAGVRGQKIYVSLAHPDPTNLFSMPMRLFEVTLQK